MATSGEERQPVDPKMTDTDGRNACDIRCSFCPSKILNRSAATLVDVEFALPNMRLKGDAREGDKVDEEKLQDYWLVEDMYTFENVGVSNTVDNVKYLACADCERGPIGWHDLTSKKSYVALSRVKHES